MDITNLIIGAAIFAGFFMFLMHLAFKRAAREADRREAQHKFYKAEVEAIKLKLAACKNKAELKKIFDGEYDQIDKNVKKSLCAQEMETSLCILLGQIIGMADVFNKIEKISQN